MRRFAVIGLGRFGRRLAANLASAGQEVIGIDHEVKIIEEIRDRVTLAIALDATDEQALRSQAIDKVDVAIVGIGDDFQARVLATVILKQMAVPRVITRAVNPIDAQIMKRVGADEVVNPEDESADRWAARLANPWFLSRFELDPGYSIVEMKTPDRWVGKTLAQLSLRREMGIHIVAIKHRHTTTDASTPAGQTLTIPLPDEPLQDQDLLVILGSDDSLSHVPQD